jgi:hypothetical protein
LKAPSSSGALDRSRACFNDKDMMDPVPESANGALQIGDAVSRMPVVAGA